MAGLAIVLTSAGRPAYAQPHSHKVLTVPFSTPTPVPGSADTGAPATTAPLPDRSPDAPPTSPLASPVPEPAPGQAPSTAPAGGASPGACGWFDVACEFRQAINAFFRGIVSDALNPVFRFLARSVLSTPRIDQTDRVRSLWATSAWIANTCFVLLVVAGGILLMGHQNLQTSYTIKDVAPRLVIAIVAANVNLPLIGQAIEFANALARAFMGHGVDETQAANTLKGLVLHQLTDGADVFTTILAMVAVLAGVVVLFTFAIRAMLLVLLTAVGPLALACHALPHTDGLARTWWRALAGVLGIQVAQALVFATAMRVFFTSDQADLFGLRHPGGSFDLVLVICLLYILARIPSWVSQMIFRGGMGRSPIVRAARTIAAILIFRRIGAATRAGRTPRPPNRPPTPPPSPPVLPLPPSPPNPPTWVQPPLPFPPAPPSGGGTQAQLPINPPPPAPPGPGWTQLRLPSVPAKPAWWRQTALPLRPRYTPTRLPTPPARAHVQPELPVVFPPPGSPQAGRSLRRLADVATLRDAEARARATTPNPNPSSNTSRRSR